MTTGTLCWSDIVWIVQCN